MSSYTTEVRYIVETLAEKKGTIEEMINSAKSKIFDDYWYTENAEYKPVLEQKILRSYYTREIGQETYGLWKLKLNTTLAEIMPKYNLLYKTYDSIIDKLISNVDLTETRNDTGKATNTDNATNTSTSKGKNTGSSTGNTTATNSGSGASDAWQTSNDTPQGGLTGLEENKYLSSAVHNKGTTDQESTSSTENTATSTTDTENTTNGTSTTESVANTTNEYIKNIVGNNGGINYIDEYNKLLTGYLNIDKMIIDELEPLFMGLF
nr:MAG TPA: Lower collar protein [Caudoviricetes sp.]